MTRALPLGYYGLEDVAVGDVIDLGSRKVTEADIDAFAALTGDRFGIHMREADAQALGFPRRVAHGLLILSLVDGMKNNAPAQFRAVASLGWTWTFSAPILAGEVIAAQLEVMALRPTSRGDRGILTLDFSLTVEGSLRQKGRNQLMVLR